MKLLGLIGALAIVSAVAAAGFFFGGFYNIARNAGRPARRCLGVMRFDKPVTSMERILRHFVQRSDVGSSWRHQAENGKSWNRKVSTLARAHKRAVRILAWGAWGRGGVRGGDPAVTSRFGLRGRITEVSIIHKV